MEMLLKALSFSPFPLYLFGVLYRPLIIAGFTAQAIYLAWRGISLGRLPLVGVHDTLNFLSASIVAFSLPFWGFLGDRKRFFPMVAVMSAAFSAFAAVSKPHAMPLPPVLNTLWFEFHVALSFFSYALFGLSAIVGILWLSKEDTALERIQYKSALVGYCLFSLSMIFGGVWAYLAWGTYWLWTPKELWTTILWIFYSLYLHARLIRQFSGRVSVILGIVGFGIVLFTYLGVSLLMKSSHAF